MNGIRLTIEATILSPQAFGLNRWKNWVLRIVNLFGLKLSLELSGRESHEVNI